MKQFLRDHTAAAVVIVLLAVLGLIAFGALFGANHTIRTMNELKDVDDVGGTYCSRPAEEPGPGPVYYYVFDHGEYTFYRLWEEPVETGTYEQDGEVVILTGENGTRRLLVKGRYIYDFDWEKEQWCKYYRYSDTPYYINAPGMTGPEE